MNIFKYYLQSTSSGVSFHQIERKHTKHNRRVHVVRHFFFFEVTQKLILSEISSNLTAHILF